MIRTGYSFKTAIGHLPEVVSRLEEIAWPAFPICDRSSTFGFVRWRAACAAAKVRPVYGAELAVSPEIGSKRPSLDWWTFLAGTDLRPLHELVHRATGNPSAALSYEDAVAAAKAGGVLAVAGPHVILDRLPRSIPIALCPGIPAGQLRRALEERRDLVARPNNRFPRAADRELYRIAMGRSAEVQTWPQWILSDEEYVETMLASAPDLLTMETVEGALERRDALLAASRAELRQAAVLSPARPKTLRAMCLDGAARLGMVPLPQVYRERMDRELEMIAQKKFEDYFYIIADMVSWAKDRMVVGPARGSSCGSLVCYLLDITAVDPIPHGLLFERFIDLTRADLPDIDLDFSDQRRDLVLRYVEKKYGDDHVARLGSVMMFRPKSILVRFGIGLRVPSWEIDELSNTVVHRSFGDSRAAETMADTFATPLGARLLGEYPGMMLGTRVENHPNAAGQHAAGVVITQDPVLDVVAVNGSNGATMCDKRDAEALGLLKIDALGLTQLSVFERCLELIGEDGMSRFLERIPLDDAAAIDVLNQRKFCGVFQFVPGSASANLVTELVASRGGRFEKFQDIVDLTAVVRPGPLGSGQTDRWLARKAGMEEVSFFHECVRPYVESTLGIIIYQEQVMQIGRNVGDLTWDDVTALRKAMSKSLGKEYFDKWGDRWKAGARKRGMTAPQADEFWNALCQFGMWAFNKSHSVAYATVSYWCLWLKAHHPLEFGAATLDAEKDPMAQITILRELRAEGVSYVPIDPDRSTDRWQTAGGRLIGPLTSIRGIGPKKVATILDNRRLNSRRKKGDPAIPLPPGLRKLLEDCRTEIDSLTPVSDAVARLHPDGATKTTPVPIAEAVPRAHRGEVVVVGLIKRLAPLDENDAGRVAKRGGRRIAYGPTAALNFSLMDDHGADIFCKIDRYQFDQHPYGQRMVEQARAGKSLYAVRGIVPDYFRMIKVTAVKYLGEIDGEVVSELGRPGGDRDVRADDPSREVGVADRQGDTGGDAELDNRTVAPGRGEGQGAEDEAAEADGGGNRRGRGGKKGGTEAAPPRVPRGGRAERRRPSGDVPEPARGDGRR